MKIGDFYIVPESIEEDKFIDQEIDFLLDLSLRGHDYIKNKDEYGKIVLNRLNIWNKGNGYNGIETSNINP